LNQKLKEKERGKPPPPQLLYYVFLITKHRSGCEKEASKKTYWGYVGESNK
jgi:hypothetical protein